MPGHISTRIIHAATGPLVRSAGPAVAEAVKHFMQFMGFLAFGCVVILVSTIFGANGIPWYVIKSAVMILGLIPLSLGAAVFIEQIRLTYDRQDSSVYSEVEPFEQRKPIGYE